MPSYRRNHIVPRSYLELFADGGEVLCHFVGTAASKRLSTSDVGVRKNFYVERLPDGSRSTAVEQAMAPLEGDAVEIMRALPDHWPLGMTEHAKLSEYIALQAIRGTAWRTFFNKERTRSLQRRALPPGSAQDQLEGYSASDRFRFEVMIGHIPKLATLVASMHWSLLCFRSARLLTSDHPVVPVPIARGEVEPMSAVPRYGFGNVREFYFPVTPRAALLLTWLDEPHAPRPFSGRVHHARAINTGARAQADQHWFQLPGSRTPLASGALTPISPEFLSAYGLMPAIRSERRARALSAVNEMVESDEPPERMEVVSVSPVRPV